jgi:hypothetical protein
LNGQQLTSGEALNALTDSNGEPLLNLERNIVNVCINDNENGQFVQVEQAQEQLPSEPSIDNNVYVVWHDFNFHTASFDIFFAASNDNGQTFSTPKNISNNIGGTSPQISSSTS